MQIHMYVYSKNYNNTFFTVVRKQYFLGYGLKSFVVVSRCSKN